MTEKDQQKHEEELLQEQDDTQEASTDNQIDHDTQEPSIHIQVVQDEQFELMEDELTANEQQGIVEATPVKPNRASKGWMIASIVLFAALIYALIQPPFNKNNESIAKVNDVSISKDMLYDKMIETGGSSILENMIVEEVLNQEAADLGIKVTKEDLDTEIAMYKSGATDEEWEAMLLQNGTTEEQLRLDIVLNIQLRKLLEPQTPVTEEEITSFYNENLEAMTTDDKIPTLEEKKEEIKYQLVYQKVSQLASAYIEEVKGKANIENTLLVE